MAEDNAIKVKQLRAIHAAVKANGLTDDVYRCMLENNYGVSSSKDLSYTDRMKVLDELNGSKPRVYVKFSDSDPEKGKLLRKLAMMLSEAGRNAEYGHALAKRMYKVHRVEWCTPSQLCALIGELSQDKKRRQKSSEKLAG